MFLIGRKSYSFAEILRIIFIGHEGRGLIHQTRDTTNNLLKIRLDKSSPKDGFNSKLY